MRFFRVEGRIRRLSILDCHPASEADHHVTMKVLASVDHVQARHNMSEGCVHQEQGVQELRVLDSRHHILRVDESVVV